MTESFQRRTMPIGELIRETTALVRDSGKIRSAMRNKQLTPSFRERLMLAVTAVNRCRYCSYAHSKAALTAGLSAEEVAELCGGVYDSCPQEEMPALLFAEHWAETDGYPDEDARQEVSARYGEALLQDIEVVLRMIRMGNMYGNAWDRFLYNISFGRWGGCD